MSWKNIKFVRNAYYEILSKENYEETYILDSNVVMHLRKLFYSPDKMSDEDITGFLGLVEFLYQKKVVISVAVQELSWDVEKLAIDQVKSSRIEEAMNTLFFSPEEKKRILNKTPYEGTELPSKGGKREIRSIYENSLNNNPVVPTIAIMLKFKELILKYDIHEEYKVIYLKLCNFMEKELELVGAYELYLIQYVLFSKDERVTEIRKLLKLDNKKDSYQKNLWNASWDIFFMRSISSLAMRKLRGESTDNMDNPVLVTLDENLYKLTSFLVSDMKTKYINGNKYPALRYVSNNEDDNNLILSSAEALNITARERVTKHNNTSLYERVEQFKKIIKATEENIDNLVNCNSKK